jgi:hypothetical protein
MTEDVFMVGWVAMKTRIIAESYSAFLDPPTKPRMAGERLI